MILVGIGYTVSSVFAVNPNQTIQTSQISSETQSQSEEKLFSSLEKHVATTATSLRNQLLGSTNMVNQKEDTEQSDQNNSDEHNSSSITLDTVSSRPLPKVYDDIETSPAKEEILILYSNNLIKEGKDFYPNNYVRISDFIRVVVDAYRVQQNMDPKSLEGLTKNEYFSYTTVPVEVLVRVNSAYEVWFLQKLALEDWEWNTRLQEFISPQEAKDILILMEIKSPSLVTYPSNYSFSSDTTLTKEEMAQLVVQAFRLKLNERSLPVFSDISWTPYQDAIQKLARLWIVSWVQGKFYPDAKVENKDFIVMLARSIIVKQWSPISIDNFYYLTPLQNVSTTATYAPYLEYCLESQICNSLLSQESWGVSFQPNRLLSRSEIDTILSTVTKIKFNVPDSRSREFMTRGELAHLLVSAFGFDEENFDSSSNTTSNINKESFNSASRRESFKQLMKIS